MATIDMRGNVLSAADPPIATNPNPDLAIKAPVRLATTGSNITLSGLQTTDGVALAAGDRVLVKDQTDRTTNGLYNAATGNWTRTIDANNNSQLTTETLIAVAAGSANAATIWQLTAANPVTLGTSLLTFAQLIGNVVGAASAAAGHAAIFADATGKVLADSKITLTAPATGATLTVPDGSTVTFQGTDTYVGRATTDTLINKTFDTGGTGNVLKLNGTQVASIGGGLAAAGSNVLAIAALGLNMVNGTIVQSQAGNAQTFAIKTLAGADPSSSDPVLFQFRNATAATGNYVSRQVTAALSITIPSGQALGFVNATPGRAWIGALDNAGTVELFVINALTATSTSTVIYPLQGWGIISTSAVSGASAAQVAYSTAARSSLAYVTLGYATWEAGGTLATAGTWNAAPTRMQLFQAGSTPLPGQSIQTVSAVISAASTTTSATYVALTSQNISLTPTSSANMIAVFATGSKGTGVSATQGMRLSRGTAAATNLIGNELIDGGNFGLGITLSAYDFPGTLSSQTYAVQGKTSAGTLTYSSNPAFMSAQEIMG